MEEETGVTLVDPVWTLYREMARLEPVEAADHLLAACASQPGADAVTLVAARRHGDYFKPCSARAYGFDSAQANKVQDFYFEGNGYLLDPLGLYANRNRQRVVFSRRSAVGDKEWYECPQYAFRRDLGLDDQLIGHSQMGDHSIFLGLHRTRGSSRFSQKQVTNFEVLIECLRHFFQLLLKESVLQCRPQVDLPSRHKRVLTGLLRGLSEKEVAADLNLSLATVHKYVEELYRLYAVHSRPQLMALWIPNQEKRFQPALYEFIERPATAQA